MTTSTSQSPESSTLSETPSDPEAYHRMTEAANSVLNKYKSNLETDYTQRVLKAFVNHLPPHGAYNICNDILENTDDSYLSELAKNLVTALLLPCKTHFCYTRRSLTFVSIVKATGHTPAAIPSPSIGAECDTHEIETELVEQTTRKDQKWLRNACLRRDAGRCILTGACDIGKGTIEDQNEEVAYAFLETTHIIPYTYGVFSEAEVTMSRLCRYTMLTVFQRSQKAVIWETLYRCFPSPRSRSTMKVENINDTSNALTLASDLHKAFGMFHFALEPTVSIIWLPGLLLRTKFLEL